MPDTNPSPRRVQIVRHGTTLTVQLPPDVTLPGDSALLRVEGNRLVIEPDDDGRSSRERLLALLATLEPLPPEDRMPHIPRPPAEPVDW